MNGESPESVWRISAVSNPSWLQLADLYRATEGESQTPLHESDELGDETPVILVAYGRGSYYKPKPFHPSSEMQLDDVFYPTLSEPTSDIHHGWLSPNLDTLVGKDEHDRRTNWYRLTSRGRSELTARAEWEEQYVDQALKRIPV